MAEPPSAVVMMEACGSAHYWAREMVKLGHEVKLIAPQYVKPFVKRQKNDAADAEAIVIAAQRPEMRFVEPKSEEQQARAVLFRARKRLFISALIWRMHCVLFSTNSAISSHKESNSLNASRGSSRTRIAICPSSTQQQTESLAAW